MAKNKSKKKGSLDDSQIKEFNNKQDSNEILLKERSRIYNHNTIDKENIDENENQSIDEYYLAIPNHNANKGTNDSNNSLQKINRNSIGYIIQEKIKPDLNGKNTKDIEEKNNIVRYSYFIIIN